jgi:hypothetical protein
MYESPRTRKDKTSASDESSDDSPPEAQQSPRRSPSAPVYSFATWTGAAYSGNRILYISIGAAAVVMGSIAAALWLTRQG